MKYVESFILGVCGAFLALLLQIMLVPEHAFEIISQNAAPKITLPTLLWIIVAATTEEVVRLVLIARYALMRGIPHNWWVYGALFGCGFGLTELALRLSSITLATAPLAATAVLLHILLSIFVTRALPYFPFLQATLTLLFLVVLHSLYNAVVLFGIPLVHTWAS